MKTCLTNKVKLEMLEDRLVILMADPEITQPSILKLLHHFLVVEARFNLLEGKMIILILEQTLHILRKRFIS